MTAGYRLLASNTAITLGGRVLAIAVSVILSPVLFRSLGPERYGAWSLLMMVAGYSTLLDFGLSSALERRVARLWHGGQHRAIIATLNSTLLLLAGVLLAAQVIVFVVWLMFSNGAGARHELMRGLLVLPFCAAMTLAGLIVASILTGQQRMLSSQTSRTFGLAMGAVVTIVCVAVGIRRLDALLLAYTSGNVIVVWGCWRAVRRTIPSLRFSPAWDSEAISELVRLGGLMQLTSAVPLLAEYAFRLIVGMRFGLAMAGVYDLGARAAIVLRSMAGALFTAMVPFAVQTYAMTGSPGLRRLTRLTTRYTAFAVLPASGLLVAFASPLVHLWLGASAAVPVVARIFAVLVIAHAVIAVSVPTTMVARALGRPGPETFVNTIAFGAGVLLAQSAASFFDAVIILWALPAVATFLLAIWIGRRLSVGFARWADLVLAAALAGALFAVARWASRSAPIEFVWLVVLLVGGFALVIIGTIVALGLVRLDLGRPSIHRWLTGRDEAKR